MVAFIIIVTLVVAGGFLFSAPRKAEPVRIQVRIAEVIRRSQQK